MSAWNQLYTALWPVMDRSFAGLPRRLRQDRRQQADSPEQTRERQWQALVRLLRHAHQTCPFYRERFAAAGIDPARLQSPEDLRRLPPLTRAELQQHGPLIRSHQFAVAAMQPAASGGTTDTPVPLWRDWESVCAKHAVQVALNAWAGWRPGDKVFHLWGASSDFAVHPSWRWQFYQRYVKRDVFASTSFLTPTILEQYRQQLNRFRPRIVNAYPTPLALWAEFLLACGRLYHRPHSIVVTAEALLPQQRQVIERAFACPVHEQYGSREFGMIGAQCEALGSLHLHPGAAWVDYEPVAGSTSLRQLLVTDLLNYGMPLIRYQINDCATEAPRPCPCGRGYPVLAPIAGRSADVFRLPGGALVPGVALTNRVLQVVPGLRKTQIIQEELRRFHLRYVPGPSFTPADLEPLRRKLAEFLGEGLDWEWEAVEEIPREASGKTRFCICKLGALAAAGEPHG